MPVRASTVATAQVGPPRFIAPSMIACWIAGVVPQAGSDTIGSLGIDTTVAWVCDALTWNKMMLSDRLVLGAVPNSAWPPACPLRVCDPRMRKFSTPLAEGGGWFLIGPIVITLRFASRCR